MRISFKVKWLLLIVLIICGTPVYCQELPRLVIAKDTVWQGDVKIEGVVVVKKGATLTIAQGTQVVFPKLDTNNDGIGECEIVVEGSLLAKGTKENPIKFTSAASKPDKRDWKFIMVNFSPAAELEYCIIEYAFSAVQVHFSTASIKNCYLRHCEDGMRYSTAKVTIAHNQFTDNIYGIRYEERGSQALIEYNNITDNDYGIFCVLKSDNLSRFAHNNIYNNRKYNVLLGVNQDKDLTLPDNYWGETDVKAVSAKIFARNYEPSLGAVDVTPLLDTKVAASGVE